MYLRVHAASRRERRIGSARIAPQVTLAAASRLAIPVAATLDHLAKAPPVAGNNVPIAVSS